jgi:hypothetical protein
LSIITQIGEEEMSAEIMGKLQLLDSDSETRLPSHTIAGLTALVQAKGEAAVQLIQPKRIANANWVSVPKHGVSSLSDPKNISRRRKLMTISPSREDGFTHRLNTALLGGKSYPILTTVLGVAGGYFSAGGSLIFAATSTALDVSKSAQRILARPGDEIWQVEEIGKVRNGAAYQAVHVNSIWLADPYRQQSPMKGWLIHQQRSELILE